MGTHPIFESDFDCLTDFSPNDLRDWKMSRIYTTKHEFWAGMKNHVEEMRYEKAKASIEKAEQIFLRQHLLNSKKYKLSAEEDTEEKLRKIHLQRRKTMIQLNPPISQPDFNRRMTKLTIVDPISLRHLQDLDEKRIERKKLIRRRWRKSLIIAKFNLEHKKIRQQQLTLTITGNRSTRFEERVLENSKNESQLTAPGFWKLKKSSDVQKFHRRFTRQSIATRTPDFDILLKKIQKKETDDRKMKARFEQDRKLVDTVS